MDFTEVEEDVFDGLFGQRLRRFLGFLGFVEFVGFFGYLGWNERIFAVAEDGAVTGPRIFDQFREIFYQTGPKF